MSKFRVGDRVVMTDPTARIEEEFGMGAEGEGLIGTVTKIEPIVQTDTYQEYLLYVDFDDEPLLNNKPQFHWRFNHYEEV